MKKELSLTVKIRQYFKTEFLTELSAALMVALGIKVFSAPNLIVGGGVSGIASVLYVLFGLPIGAVSLALNLPLLFIGWRKLGNRFTFRTLRVVAVISLVTDIALADVPAYLGEKLIAAIFAGIFLGIGLGIILNRGDSTGGTDILVKLIQLKFRHVTLGSIVMLTDVVVVAAAALAYKSIDTVLYGSIMIIVSSAVIGLVTFVICYVGIALGKKFGTYLSNKAGILGGVMAGVIILVGGRMFIWNRQRLKNGYVPKFDDEE